MDYLLNKLNKDVMTIVDDYLRETEEERRLNFILTNTFGKEEKVLLYTHLRRYNLDYIYFFGHILCSCNSIIQSSYYKKHLKSLKHIKELKENHLTMNVLYNLI